MNNWANVYDKIILKKLGTKTLGNKKNRWKVKKN